jgi:hypothetical protein
VYNVKCQCGKIVCQVANMPDLPRTTEAPASLDGPAAVILCRHCKRYVVLQIPGIKAVQFTSGITPPREEPRPLAHV